MIFAILGQGGREHALAWKLTQSKLVDRVYVCPGNPGMESTNKVIPVGEKNWSKEKLANFCKQRKIDICIIGPEVPLCEGYVDYLEVQGIATFGPSADCARLEGSKAWCKEFMLEFNIPTAPFEVACELKEAKDIIERRFQEWKGVVLKADGPCAGKGVVVCPTLEMANLHLNEMMDPNHPRFAHKLVIEKPIIGREISMFALCDGKNFTYVGAACDHKRLLDNDKGPNTGGMGVFTPANWPIQNDEVFRKVLFENVLSGMQKRGHAFKGVLFAGVMIDENNCPWVLEYNVRFGDPETQALLPVLDQDMALLFSLATQGKLNEAPIVKQSSKKSVHVVMASKNYASYENEPLLLKQKIELPKESIDSDSTIFYAGVELVPGLGLINSGGRVLGVTSLAPTVTEAREKAYKVISKIHFNGSQYRKDIGKKDEYIS